MGGNTSKESLEKVLVYFSQNEKDHLLQLFDELCDDPQKTSIHEAAFTKFCVLIPEDYRLGLYRSIMHIATKKHKNDHVVHKIEFLEAVKSIVKGNIEEKSKFCFEWCNGGKEEATVTDMKNFIRMTSSTAMGIHPLKKKYRFHYQVSESWVDYLYNLPFNQKKSFFHDNTNSQVEVTSFSYFQFSDWLEKNILFMTLIERVFTRMFMRSKDIYHSASQPNLLDLNTSRKIKRERGLNPPKLTDQSELLRTEDVWFLSMHVPPDCRHQWNLLFSTSKHGKSWSRFNANILEQGSTIVVIKDKDGYIFGGFNFEQWKKCPNFYGSADNFLFSLQPTFGSYSPSNLNQNYQYLNFGTKTLPNALAFGGQFDYFGLCVHEDFGTGHSKAEPLSTTYNSPRLSKSQEFIVDAIEVWQVLEPVIDPNREDPKQKSILDAYKEDVMILQMAGKSKGYSDGLREEKKDDSDEE